VNHINFLEVPLLYVLLRPRRVIGLAKVETWDNPVLRVLANLWEAIPIRRSGVNTRAFRRAAQELQRGAIVAIAPEGLRTYDGRLRKANAGVVTLAARTGAPVLPVAHYGGETFWRSLRRVRRTRVTIRVGHPILFRPVEPAALTRAERDRRLRTIMVAIARLLPPTYRGFYRRDAACR
jgi:1-acyl-sn-glycerol-3-phosphate acyltransferase